MIMKHQTTDEIINFLRNNVEPLEDNIYGPGYRASVYLTDGTFLPCVIFRNPESTIKFAKQRFDEERNTPAVGYDPVIKVFVTAGNRINDYDVARVEKSRYALPIPVLKQIEGETTMSWTGFAVKMKDGKLFGFGTTFLFEFFEMPDQYSADDIAEIVNHSYVTASGELRSHKVPFFGLPNDYDSSIIFRERPYFKCFVDSL